MLTGEEGEAVGDGEGECRESPINFLIESPWAAGTRAKSE